MYLFMGNIAFQGFYFHVVKLVPALRTARDPGLASFLYLAIKVQIPISKYPSDSCGVSSRLLPYFLVLSPLLRPCGFPLLSEIHLDSQRMIVEFYISFQVFLGREHFHYSMFYFFNCSLILQFYTKPTITFDFQMLFEIVYLLFSYSSL